MFIAIVRLRHRIDVAVGKLHCGKPFPFRLRQILIQPRLPDQLGELAFGQVLFPHGRHPLYMALGIVRQKQTQGRIEQILHAHGSQFALISVRRDAKVTADQILESDKDPELLRRLFRVQVFVVIGPYASDGKIQAVSLDFLVNGRYLETEHHPLVVDRLVRFEQLADGFVDRFGNPPLDDMRYPYFGLVDYLAGELLMRRAPYRLDKVLMRNRHLVVLAEDGDHAILFQMGQVDGFRIRLDKATGRRRGIRTQQGNVAGLGFGYRDSRGFRSVSDESVEQTVAFSRPRLRCLCVHGSDGIEGC